MKIPIKGSNRARAHVRHIRPTFKQVAKTTYEIATSISDVNTFMSGSPKEKAKVIIGRLVPYYRAISIGKKLIRKL